ncbi:ABC transporter ATP-binding protein [Marinimicrobium sp. ABcell2]|uniref:ABC transporter ATP-binding protein n=1 Tax=Marinimicrobium sp. ABcell2 TaxID=3069751 RepID=UPI0027B04942|nr:ABC transporter ATP-binding protein [Marinimicrobium sp. ABcell2]MDQ2076980.1 ABC transporter ATP-binding protein [Marinimicrobium sp. ABcell2]
MLSVEALTFGYRKQQTQIVDVSFSLASGDILGLLGPNGAGKTTLVSLIAGLLKPQSGRVLIDGSPTHLGRRDIALVPQEYAFYPRLTARENLLYFAGALGLSRAEARTRTDSALQSCELTDRQHQRAGHYSGGLKRRLNFAIALLQQPRLLILDEPTAGVDPQSRAFLLDTIRQLNQQGTTLIYTSHLLSEVESLCRSVAVLNAGRIILQGDLETLLAEQHSQVHVKLPQTPAPELLAKSPAQSKEQGWWAFDLEASELSVSELLGKLEQAGNSPTQIRYGQQRLEEVFLTATHREERPS